MTAMLAPVRGGFLRPFGCGWFIREFLLGHGPEGPPKIDPDVGACQEDIFYHYKIALHKAYAEDAIAYENEERIKKGLLIYTEIEYMERLEWYLRRIPYKLVKCRYHSFVTYFGMLKKLEWVEFTGKEEKSTPQDYYEGFQPRIYYRLTKKGIGAPDYQWSNPHLILYPEYSLEYFREKRKEHHYSKKAPTKSRRTVKTTA
jgi:hypothetical protein